MIVLSQPPFDAIGPLEAAAHAYEMSARVIAEQIEGSSVREGCPRGSEM